MDFPGAKRIIDSVLGKQVGGWQITELSGSGKSAVVFKAVRGGEVAALKVFDPDLVERSGREAQLERIRRELSLRGKVHPHLVRILDGGQCSVTNYMYVVMEFIEAPNLASVIKKVPREKIRLIVAQIASGARFLEDLDVVHRDIKTDNISISPDFNHSTLLDLGVIRPLDLTDAVPSSDGERKAFVGTLRYSPPEFAFRKESKDKLGYRAITFYQLGGVLHDLIMRGRLFELFEDPYTRLVKAVDEEVPLINAADVPEDLMLLAKNCLLKSPELRLRFVDWQAFDLEKTVAAAGTAARERLRRRFAQTYELGSVVDTAAEQERRAAGRSLQRMQSTVRNLIVSECVDNEFIPRVESNEFQSVDGRTGFLQLSFAAAPLHGYRRPLSIVLRFEVIDAKSEAVQISYAAATASQGLAQQAAASAKMSAVFSGVFQEDVLRTRAMDLVYQLLEAAQQHQDSPDDPCWLTSSVPEGE